MADAARALDVAISVDDRGRGRGAGYSSPSHRKRKRLPVDKLAHKITIKIDTLYAPHMRARATPRACAEGSRP